MGRRAKGLGSIPKALVLSLVAHVALLFVATLPAAAERPDTHAKAPADPLDVWAGTTSDLPGLYEVEVASGGDEGSESAGSAAAPPPAAAPSPPAAPDPPEAPEAPPPPAPEPPKAPEEEAPLAPEPPPAPAAPAPKAPKPRPVIPGPIAPPAPPSAKPAPAPAETAEEVYGDPEPSPPAGSASPKAPVAAKGPGGEGEPTASSGSSGTFGAAGDAAPVRDLGRAFTRAIPPACQADSAWAEIPLGDAGTLDVEIFVDASGRVSGWHPIGDDGPPLHLAGLMRRTIALLGAGTFAVQGAEGDAGRQVLRIRATVSDRPGGEQGGEAGLAFQYDGKVGLAGFTQPGGRHVEVRIEVRPGS